MMTTDLYPSRVAEHASVTPRHDPVVHGTAAQRRAGPLSADELAFFEENGYLFWPSHFSPAEVDRLRRELDTMQTAAARTDSGMDVIREPGGTAVRSIFAVHDGSPIFAALARDPRLCGSARQILGGDVYIHQSRINFKPGFTGKEFYWHSDFETWHVEDGMPHMRAISFSLLLDDNFPYNGPLMVMPGSHHHYISCVGKTPADHYKQSLRRQEYGVPDPESLTRLYEQCGIAIPTGPAGSVLMFDCNVMHGSNSNITPLSRRNVFMVYNSMANTLGTPFADVPPRPEHIACRRPTAL